MAKRRKKSNSELSTENELLKLKMMAEFGGEFVGSEQLPPDVEHAFLKQISRFQQKHQTAPMVKIYDFIGTPDYNLVHDLSDKEVPKELKKLLRILRKKGIIVDTLSGVSDREMYRFITEEIFKQEIQNIKMPNWAVHMVYEEFHPSDEFDIKNQCGHALAFLFDKQYFAVDFIFAEEMKNHIGLSMDREELIEKIDTFKLGFNQMEFTGAEFKVIEITDDKLHAHVEVMADYRTQLLKGRRFKSDSALIEIDLIKDPETNFWLIESLKYDQL
jgi:hypothetical protein